MMEHLEVAGLGLHQRLELGVEIEAVATRDYAAACSLLLDQAVARGFRHRTEPVLNAALAAAVKADVGDGAWKWSRRNSLTDISPLVAATLALWAAAEPVSVAGFVDLDSFLDD